MPLCALNPLARRTVLVLAAALLSAMVCASTRAARGDDPLPADAVGTIDGAAIAVSGPMRVDIVHGFARTMLRSGSEVRVTSGTARLELVEGGFISICGPAHFSVLKSGKMLTVALDTGSIHAYIERDGALTIYTPQILAQTLAIGDAPQDALVGFDETGAMCVRAYRGAVRLEQQLSGQTVIVPQSSGVLVVQGQLDGLRDGGNRCSCDPQLTKYTPAPVEVTPAPRPVEEVRVRSLQPQAGDAPLVVARPATKDEPIYEVFMPPLVFDARARVQPEIDPKLITLVRHVRVRSSLIFQGKVQGDKASAASPAPSARPAGERKETPAPRTESVVAPAASAAPVAPNAAKTVTPTSGSFANRVRSFVRRLWSR